MVQHAERKADCPNCGGPVEFKLGSSLTCVCEYCRFAIVRTELSVEAIGKVAQLVPTAPIMAVGDRGSLDGRGFEVGGRLQLDHGAGPWDEWYIAYEDGSWGWLAKAQGQLHTTQALPAEDLPNWESLTPGSQLNLPGTGEAFTVAERGGSAVVSAEGELPMVVDPRASGRYVDLSGPGGLFATIDYGDGSEAPALFVGRTLGPEALTVEGRGLRPAPSEKVDTARLRCPTCGAPVPIQTPESTERAACGSCNSLLDFEAGNLRYLAKLDQPELHPAIPLGSSGNVLGEEVLVIGYLRRSCPGEYYRYTWSEYLVHTRYGYRWLLESDGHFTYLRPTPAGKVKQGSGSATYRGERYRSFTSSTATVDAVVGEFYWRVQQGDRSRTQDFVAPPKMLSYEATDSEVNWSAGEYIDGKTLWQDLSLPGNPPVSSGVAPAQPNPHVGRMKLAGGLLLALAITAMVLPGASSPPLDETRLNVPPSPGEQATEQTSVTLTEPFDVSRSTLRLDLETNLSNAWIAVATALINEDTGEVREFFVQTEEWHGPDYSEGGPNQSEYIDRLPPGRYSLRYDVRWGKQTGLRTGTPPRATMRAVEGDRSSLACVLAGLLILLPALVGLLRRGLFEARRWKESDQGQNLQDMMGEDD